MHILPQLLAQRTDMHTHRVASFKIGFPPHLLENMLRAENLLGVGCQHEQDIKLLRRQLNQLAVKINRPFLRINHQTSRFQHGLGRGGGCELHGAP
ncbi:hypothetical protein D3C75_1153160 [compost metagenome]